MSNCNKMRKSDTFVRSTLKTKPSDEDEGEIKNEMDIFVEECNDNEPNMPCQLENSENNKDEISAMSLEDEKDTSLSHSFVVKKIYRGPASKIENNNLSDKKELNEDDILKLKIKDEIDLKNVESVQDMEITNDMADACKTVCEICHKVVTLSSMRNHTMKEHEVQITQYKQMYGNFNIIKKVYHKCHICGKTVLLDNDYLGGHIKVTHKMKEKEYKAKYMALASPRSRPSTNKKVMKDDAEENANFEVIKRGVKRKLGKFDCNSSSKTFQMSKEKNPSLVRKQKQRSDVSIESSSNPLSVLFPSKTINLKANVIKEETVEVQNDKPVENIFIAHKIIETSQDVIKEVHESKLTEDKSQDIESNGDVAKDITNKGNIKDSTDKSRDVNKDINSEWISDCENNGLFCNGGPTLMKGWKICFEEWEIDGCKVMLAKYMSPAGTIYTRGENGYQIPDVVY